MSGAPSQAFRTRKSSRITTIPTRFDTKRGGRVVRWSDILQYFGNTVRCVTSGRDVVLFLTDDDLENLMPLRIAYYPDVALVVVTEDQLQEELNSTNDTSPREDERDHDPSSNPTSSHQPRPMRSIMYGSQLTEASNNQVLVVRSRDDHSQTPAQTPPMSEQCDRQLLKMEPIRAIQEELRQIRQQMQRQIEGVQQGIQVQLEGFHQLVRDQHEESQQRMQVELERVRQLVQDQHEESRQRTQQQIEGVQQWVQGQQQESQQRMQQQIEGVQQLVQGQHEETRKAIERQIDEAVQRSQQSNPQEPIGETMTLSKVVEQLDEIQPQILEANVRTKEWLNATIDTNQERMDDTPICVEQQQHDAAQPSWEVWI
ncbi:hypothetical protein B0O80DRAFT_531130 [Mortierella sp. GBAus27b]|nr:hypothetical protein BGX31_006377 [Mortierella sp. GBA43]KAI8350793.1 hypothetical protein B0O80DRAFT_531130 [Mortierella sp. GBAus27b]